MRAERSHDHVSIRLRGGHRGARGVRAKHRESARDGAGRNRGRENGGDDRESNRVSEQGRESRPRAERVHHRGRLGQAPRVAGVRVHGGREHDQGAMDHRRQRVDVYLGFFRQRVARRDDPGGVRGVRRQGYRPRDVRRRFLGRLHSPQRRRRVGHSQDVHSGQRRPTGVGRALAASRSSRDRASRSSRRVRRYDVVTLRFSDHPRL